MKQVIVYFRYHQDRDYSYLADVLELLHLSDYEIFLPGRLEISHETLFRKKFPYRTYSGYEDMPKNASLFITYGGDGTILRAATIIRDSGIPIFGINAGRLGFLAYIPKENSTEAIRKFLDNNYYLQARSLISVDIKNFDFPEKGLNFALNELTVSRKNTTSMINVDVYINDEFLSTYWADGLIVSTPTGSTGYSMSCGGPILTPDTHDFIINAIAPHNLTVRPLVLPNHNRIKLIPHGREEELLLSLDSRVMSIPFTTEIEVCKAPFKINFIQLDDYTFIKTLRRKLFWGYDNRNV
jgi:NAD+ kinase